MRGLDRVVQLCEHGCGGRVPECESDGNKQMHIAAIVQLRYGGDHACVSFCERVNCGWKRLKIQSFVDAYRCAVKRVLTSPQAVEARIKKHIDSESCRLARRLGVCGNLM